MAITWTVSSQQTKPIRGSGFIKKKSNKRGHKQSPLNEATFTMTTFDYNYQNSFQFCFLSYIYM